MAIRPELHRAVAKTKSKASEYNDNFDMMMDFIDDSIGESKDYVDEFMPSVTGQSGKFLTNNGTVTSWASLGNQPFGDIINGLVITKSSDDTIAISEGSCYDYAKAVILTNGSATTKQNSSQSASTTYYVYIIDGTSTDFLITTSSSSPILPTGSTTYRQIGYYTTDGDNKISTIYCYGLDMNVDHSGQAYLNMGAPDWANATTGLLINTTYTAPSNGWIIARGGNYNIAGTYVYINDVMVLADAFHYNNQGISMSSICLPISKGDTYKIVPYNNNVDYDRLWFVPIKGA